MPGTIRRISAAKSANSVDSAGSMSLAAPWILLAALLAGCSTSLTIDVDEHEDFSNYRTWDWMPEIRSRVAGPFENLPALDVRTSRRIAAELAIRGFEHTEPPADFYVTYRLSVHQRSELVEQPMAPYLLSSHNSSASYWVEGTESVERRIDDFRLVIGVTPGGSRMTWLASFERSLDPSEDLPIEAAVEKLFDRFPTLGPAAEFDAKH
jgi:hypothetical protein